MPKPHNKSPKSRSRRPPPVVVAGGLLVVVFFGVAAFVAFSADEAEPARLVTAGDAPFSLASDGENLWVGNAGDLSLSRIDLASGEPAGDAIQIPVRPGQIAIGEQLWVGAIEGSDIVRIDPADVGSPPVAFPVGRDPAAVISDGSGVWVAALNEGLVARVSASGEVTEEITELEFPSALALLDGTLWVTDVTEGTINAIEGEPAEISSTHDVGAGPTTLVAGDGRLWSALFAGRALAVVNPADGGVETIDLDAGPGGVAFGGGWVWVTLPERDSLIRIDPNSLEMSDPIPVGDNPQGVVVAGGAVWVANQGEDTVARIDLDSLE